MQGFIHFNSLTKYHAKSWYDQSTDRITADSHAKSCKMCEIILIIATQEWGFQNHQIY